jgi:PKD repeat protein
MNFREVTITDHPGNGKQITITVNHETGMKNDFSDLRFSDASATIPYWIISKTDGDTATVMIKLTSATTIYKHWGKDDAVSLSNPEEVCDLYDNFTGTNGTAPDTNKWAVIAKNSDGDNITSTTALDGNGNVVISDGSAYSGANGLVTVNPFPAGIDINFRSKISQPYNYVVAIGNRNKPQSDTYGSYSEISKMVLGGGYSFVADDATTTGGFHQNDPDAWKHILTGTLPASHPVVDNFYDHVYTWDGSVLTASTNGETPATSEADTTYQNSSLNVMFSWGWAGYDHLGTWTISEVYITKHVAIQPSLEEGAIQTTATVPPVAGYTHEQSMTVVFTDISTNSPTSWAWDFGDETTSDEPNPTHTYTVAGTYTVTLVATNPLGSDTYSIPVTVSSDGSSKIIYLRVTEMDHLVGKTAKHSFQILASDGSGFASTCTSPEIRVYKDGVASASNPQSPSWVSAFDLDMGCFWLTVPSSLDGSAFTAGQNLDINIVCTEGAGSVFLNVVPDTSTLATASSISALNNLSTSQVLAQVQSALNSYDAPTKAELDSAVSPLATTANISALNNLSTAQVLAQVQSALNSYDAPTKAEMDAALTALNDVTVADILAGTVEGSVTVVQAMRIMLAAMAGVVSGAEGTSLYFKGLDGSTNRISATVDGNGNRTAVQLNGA